MRILALEPYHDGSHKAFLQGWTRRSRHAWTILTLPARKWKWRMRHAAVTFSQEATRRLGAGGCWDLIFCSDMLNLAEFRGLSLPRLRTLPAVAYFHENQLTYPVRVEDERDYHYGLINMTTALASEEAWFNSRYHLEAFIGALASVLKRMPDHRLPGAADRIRERARVMPQGVEAFPSRPKRRSGPLRVLWAARWEHDKDPDTFVEALRLLEARAVPFRASIVGQSFRDVPPVFEQARSELSHRLDAFGFLDSRQDYEALLLEADVVVSTARHEFFGVAVAEALSAGAYPLVPRALAYPELLGGGGADEGFFHDGTPESVADRLAELARALEVTSPWGDDPERGRRLMQRYHWERLAPRLDDGLSEVRDAAH